MGAQGTINKRAGIAFIGEVRSGDMSCRYSLQTSRSILRLKASIDGGYENLRCCNSSRAYFWSEHMALSGENKRGFL
jgi:hypothetical protein